MSDTDLGGDFPKADRKVWLALVEKALKGARFEDALVSHTYDGLEIQPLYARDNAPTPGASGLPGARPHARGFRAMRGEQPWDIRQLCAFGDPAAANRAILAELEGGATSVLLRFEAPGQFGMKVRGQTELKRALDGIDLEFAAIALEAGERAGDAAKMLTAVWSGRGIAADTVRGAFNADPLGSLARAGGLSAALDQTLAEAARLAAFTRDNYPNVTAMLVDTRPYHDGGASEGQELAALCATLTAYLRTLEAAGIAPAEALPQIGFMLAADTDQFATIAKLRAARLLIARIARACGADGVMEELRLDAMTSDRMLSRRDPWDNLLRTTMACAAAVFGGAEAITVLPFSWAIGQPDPLAARLARNIQIILQEESALGAVLDPAGGSWYVETLTRELAAKAWELFQSIEAGGGMPKALAAGHVQKMIAETAKARAAKVATAEEALTGINAYPVICGRPLVPEQHPSVFDLEDPAVTVEPIPLRRPAAPFDQLRDSSNAYFDRKGIRPRVFLANLGKPSEFSARATFATNLFAAGGIVAEGEGGFTDPAAAADAFMKDGAHIACLCGSDEAYEQLAPATAKALLTVEPRHLYMAGRPGDNREKYRKAGVGTFLYRGCDILEVLRAAHDILEVRRV